MKRLRHWLFNFAAGVSLLICVLSIAAWTRSYFACDALAYSAHEDTPVVSTMRRWDFSQANGVIRLDWLEVQDLILLRPKNLPRWPRRDGWKYDTASIRPQLLQEGDSLAAKLGFAWGSSPFGLPPSSRVGGSSKASNRVFSFPHWAMTLAAAFLPACWLTGHRRRHANRPGLCTNCGYDLRATANRCPECGTVPPAAKGSTP
jgi:hypothetical protein